MTIGLIGILTRCPWAFGSVIMLVSCSRAAKTGSEEMTVRSDSVTQAAPNETTFAHPPRAAPKINALVPDSARVRRHSVVEIVIMGSGFEPGTPGRNVVELGPIRLTMVPANQTGTEIRFVIPDTYTTNSEAPPRALMAGSYMVTVHNGVGPSNAVPIKILP